jgi:hypothetical protein
MVILSILLQKTIVTDVSLSRFDEKNIQEQINMIIN